MQALGTIRNEKKKKKGSDSNKDGGSLTIQFWAGSVSTAVDILKSITQYICRILLLPTETK